MAKKYPATGRNRAEIGRRITRKRAERNTHSVENAARVRDQLDAESRAIDRAIRADETKQYIGGRLIRACSNRSARKSKGRAGGVRGVRSPLACNGLVSSGPVGVSVEERLKFLEVQAWLDSFRN